MRVALGIELRFKVLLGCVRYHPVPTVFAKGRRGSSRAPFRSGLDAYGVQKDAGQAHTEIGLKAAYDITTRP